VDGQLATPAALELLAGRVRGGDRRGQSRVGGLARAFELRTRLPHLGASLRERGLQLGADRLQRADPLALLRELVRARLQGAAGRRVAERALRLQHGEPHRVAGARRLARAQRQPPLARLRAQPRQGVQRARERGLTALREARELLRGGLGRDDRARLGCRAGTARRRPLRRGLGAREQRVALGDRLGQPPLQLGRLELQRLDGLQGLGGDPRLLALGGLGAARAPLGEHRAVDDLPAGLLRRRLGDGRRRRCGQPARERRKPATGAAGPLDPQRLGLGGHERARHEVGAAPGRGVTREARVGQRLEAVVGALRAQQQLGQPGLGDRERGPAPAHAHEAAVGP
jgi:hypothetical protein